MNLEKIVSKHPCPIIRAKIMENVNTKKNNFEDIGDVIFCGIIWQHTKEGVNFWKELYGHDTASYSDLKHLDNNYTPEPAQSPVMWRKINKDNPCADRVAAINTETPELIFTGTLEWDRYDEVVLYLGNGQYMPHFTHYLPLSELLNLPIEA